MADFVDVGLAYARTGRTERAITTLGNAAERFPQATVVYMALGRVWLETAEAQALGARAKSYQTPSNVDAPAPEKAPKLSEMKLIAYDFAKYGSSAERTRLLAKWDKEVKALPK